ncbi:MAG: tRNA lysidine(34) synthetase TilS [Candidatus Hydrogenedentes bacterium]|nr:tRNA lysidine(34) synthetase TilS [Candidatus Hydrogenedentota bacterium]
MTTLIDTFKKSIAALNPTGGPVLAAVSGGADSVALMHLFHRAAAPCAVACFDHQTRQGESAEDGRFVAAAAQALGLKFYLGGDNVAALAEASGESFEMAARRARYAFLLDTARAQGYTAIATGHHADDQAETVLLRLLRGASPAGLGGIPPRREEGGIQIIRPLLDVTRREIRAWLESERISWREDATNAEVDVLRNRVRHELLPILVRDFNPGIQEALKRLATLQRQDSALLDRLAAAALDETADKSGRLIRAVFRTLDPALQFRCMTDQLRRAAAEANFETVSRAVVFVAEGPAGKQIDLGNGVALYLSAEHAVFAALAMEEPVDEIHLTIPGVAMGFDKRFEARRPDALPPGPLAVYCHAGRQIFDGDALGDTFVIRRRSAGDRFRPLGMEGTRKLKDVFNDQGLTRPERDRQLVVESSGRIVWIPGHTVSRDAAVTEHTRRYVELCVEIRA